jgi:hypothetical protein
MVFTEDIRKTILKLANDCGPGKLFYPSEVAKFIDKDNWPRLIDQVELVASALIEEGKILITTSSKGEELAYTKRN